MSPSSIQDRDHVAHLGLAIRSEHHQRKLHAPVGGVGDVRDPCQPAEVDIVAVRDARQPTACRAPQLLPAWKPLLELGHCRTCTRHELQGQRVVVGARLDLGEAMVQGTDQQRAPTAVFEQVVLDVGLRTITHMSPSTSNNMRALRPVRRVPRRRLSTSHISSPRNRMTISRSEKEV